MDRSFRNAPQCNASLQTGHAYREHDVEPPYSIDQVAQIQKWQTWVCLELSSSSTLVYGTHEVIGTQHKHPHNERLLLLASRQLRLSVSGHTSRGGVVPMAISKTRTKTNVRSSRPVIAAVRPSFHLNTPAMYSPTNLVFSCVATSVGEPHCDATNNTAPKKFITLSES